MKRGGILVTLAQPPSQEKAREYGVTAKFNTKFATYENLQTIAQLIADGTIKAEIDHIYPLSEVRQAHKQSEARLRPGKNFIKHELIKTIMAFRSNPYNES